MTFRVAGYGRLVLQPLVAARPGCAQLLCLQGRCLAAIGSRPQVRGVWSV